MAANYVAFKHNVPALAFAAHASVLILLMGYP